MAIYKVWERRNAKVADPSSSVCDCSQLWERTSVVVNEVLGCMTGPPCIAQVKPSRKWTPPPFGVFKVNVNAALSGSSVGLSCVIRDYRGVVLGAMASVGS